jgi:alkylation response protein AidB-like acyl-CoA dehydrogenase
MATSVVSAGRRQDSKVPNTADPHKPTTRIVTFVAGLLCVTMPEEFGGSGADILSSAVVWEEVITWT